MANKGVAEPPHGPGHPQELEATPNWPVWGWLEPPLSKNGVAGHLKFLPFLLFFFFFFFKYIF
jgi:hypothetical protein